jgi:hypothetical protein
MVPDIHANTGAVCRAARNPKWILLGTKATLNAGSGSDFDDPIGNLDPSNGFIDPSRSHVELSGARFPAAQH